MRPHAPYEHQSETLLTKRGSREPEQVDVHVGERLRQRRMLLGKSQKEVAERAGITYQQLQKYELGRNRISASRLYAIAHVLDVQITYFFEDISEGLDESEPEPLTGERDRLELNRLFARIEDRRTRRGVLAMMRQLARPTDFELDEDEDEE